MLRRCGFEGKWYSWIAHCISPMCFSILVNDSPISFFCSSRGLRQGDLLSPLLFVIVMKVLGRMILAAMRGGLLYGFFVGTWVDISHFLFVDTLIVYGNDQNHLRSS
jgi:hypothetical protein